MTAKEEFSIISRDGTQLNGYEYIVDQPLAMVCMIHGLGEHADRYEHVAQFFCQEQINFYVIDLRGHGLSEGKRGHAPDYEALLTDIEELMMYARSEYNELPMFLYGHSLGGNLVSNFCLLRNTNELKGAIISSPWLTLKNAPPKWKMSLAKSLVKIWPSLTQSSELTSEMLTNDPEVNEAYRKDPLVHDRISLRLFLDCYDQGKWAIENSDRLKLPLLCFHGSDDSITSPEGTLAFAQSRKDLVSFELFTATKHEAHNDLKKERVLSLIREWMDDKL